MNRQLYTEKNEIKLLYAENTDRQLIYDMVFEEDDTWKAMIENKEDFPLSALRDEENYFFGAAPGLSKYLLIEWNNEIIGSISHTYNDGKIPNLELDMWLRSSKYTGKRLGSSAMKLLIDSLVRDYGIKTFIIRPWIKNPRAVKAYEKCGFVVIDTFNPEDYYGKYLEVAAQGDFGVEETVNMVFSIEELKNKVSIRQYEPKDEEELFLLHKREGDDWKDYWEDEGRLKYQKALANSISYLLFEDDELCGYVRCRDDDGFGVYVHDLLVDKECRGKEYGRMLMEQVCCDFPNDTIYVMSDVNPYYEKLGYEVEGTIFIVKSKS